MDPVAHTFTGAALAAAGLRRATPLATAALLLGANAPDVDAVLMFAGDHMSVAHRRGWTHGILALAVLPFLLTGLLLLWDRHVRRRRRPDAPPARAGPLLAVCALAVLTHPLLDWLNNYGMRWLMPFDGRWFYGDALFIIDPWVWLVLGGAAFLGWSKRPAALAAWAVFWLLASALVVTSPQVPTAAVALWLAGLGALMLARWLPFGAAAPGRRVEPVAVAAVVLMAVYMTVAVAANVPARAEVRAELAARGIASVSDVMVGPAPANPFAGLVVATTDDAYHVGNWNWLASPRFEPTRQIERNVDDPAFEAAARTPSARRFLTWSRFPYALIDATDETLQVRFLDARYAAGAGPGDGPTVLLQRDFTPVQRE